MTPWTVAHRAPLSREFPRLKYWCELSFPSPGDLPNPGIEPVSPALAGRFFTTDPPGKPSQPRKTYSLLVGIIKAQYWESPWRQKHQKLIFRPKRRILNLQSKGIWKFLDKRIKQIRLAQKVFGEMIYFCVMGREFLRDESVSSTGMAVYLKLLSRLQRCDVLRTR